MFDFEVIRNTFVHPAAYLLPTLAFYFLSSLFANDFLGHKTHKIP